MSSFENKNAREATYGRLVTLLDPISTEKLSLRRFRVEEVYLDILRFLNKCEHRNKDEMIVGESGKSLLALVNKYGWMNWADEKLEFLVYNHFEKYVSKKIQITPVPAKNIINVNSSFDPDSILDDAADHFLKKLSVASERLDEWINIIFYISGYYRNFNNSKYMGRCGLEEKDSETKLKPYSLGTNLILFHKLEMSKYSIGQCKICDDVFIQKRKTGMYCSNKCRVRGYKNRKLTNT